MSSRFDSSKAANPIDARVAQIIEGKPDFVLSLAADQMKGDNDGLRSLEVVVREHVQPPEFVAEVPLGMVDHEFDDVASLIEYAKRYGSETNSVVLVADDGVRLVLHEEPDSGRREVVQASYGLTHEWNQWVEATSGKEIGHREMVRFLRANRHTLIDSKILDVMASAPVNSTIDTESDIRRDRATLGVTFKAAAGQKLLEFPERFDVKIPALTQDLADEESWLVLTVHLVIQLPTSPMEGLTFLLQAPRMRAELAKRLDRVVGELKDELTDWLIVRGRPRYSAIPTTRDFAEGDAN